MKQKSQIEICVLGSMEDRNLENFELFQIMNILDQDEIFLYLSAVMSRLTIIYQLEEKSIQFLMKNGVQMDTTSYLKDLRKRAKGWINQIDPEKWLEEIRGDYGDPFSHK